MRLGWYLDFGIGGLNAPGSFGMEYLPFISVKQWKLNADGTQTLCSVGNTNYLNSYAVSPSPSQIPALVTSHPGRTWIIGNEMERRDWGGSGYCSSQNEMLPNLYAQAYHDLYYLIKGADPTAQVAIGGMVEATPLRLQYLDSVWATYSSLYGSPMPVDVWNIHMYVLREQSGSWGADIPAGSSATQGMLYTYADHKDFTKVEAQILDLRTWMKSHGQQNRPLITTEFGVLFPEWVVDPANPSQVLFSPPQVRDSYMYPAFDYFLNQTDPNLGYPADGNRLVQRWNWWSLDFDDGQCDTGVFYPYNNSNLLSSGLGPSTAPTNCPFPAKGQTPYFGYWKQYVQSLPGGSTRPYSATSATREAVYSTAPELANATADTSNCSSDLQTRSSLLQSLKESDDRLVAISKLTGGTRICASSLP
ncbi:MAG: hypothetical protein M1570_05890 [Chloroflexi bacterium]|nr:hypothetical protein [Chloroflexota bacterium]